jgi:hypothetical protein
MIDLNLVDEQDVLAITVVNIGEKSLRLWARDNSWGWSMFSLSLALAGSDQWKELTAKPVRWTANVPHALDLPPRGHLEYHLRRRDPSWAGLDDVEAWLNQSFQLQVRLQVPETPEALAHGVFIGKAFSAPILPKRPCNWLAD